MLKSISVAAAALMAAGAALGQSAAPLSFDVASVKSAPPGPWRESKVGDDRIDFPRVTLRACLAFAYGVKEYQVSGPAWLGELRYDVIAKGPEGTRRDQLPEMMKALLRERFRLEAHLEKREFSVLALQVGKNGPKLKESPPAEPGAASGATFGMSMSGAGIGRLEARRADMTALANTLPRLVGRPVVDLTGLAGRYDFELEFSPQDARAIVMPAPTGSEAPAPEVGASIYTSIQRVGLKLDTQKVPLDAIVVDRAEKAPIEN